MEGNALRRNVKRGFTSSRGEDNRVYRKGEPSIEKQIRACSPVIMSRAEPDAIEKGAVHGAAQESVRGAAPGDEARGFEQSSIPERVANCSSTVPVTASER